MFNNKVMDSRNTSNGMTPNKAIRRPDNAAVKKPVGNFMKSMKPMKLNPGKRGG